MINEILKPINYLIESIKNNIDIEEFGMCCIKEHIDPKENVINYKLDIYIYVKNVINENFLKLCVYKIIKNSLIISLYINEKIIVNEIIGINQSGELNEKELKKLIGFIENNIDKI